MSVTDVAVFETNAIVGADGATAGIEKRKICGVSNPVTEEVVTAPFPNCPNVLAPQQASRREVVAAHAVCPPVSSVAMSVNPVT